MVRNERADETDAPRRDWPPGGHLGDREESEGVEGKPDRAKVLEGAGYDGIRHRTEGNERGIDTNALRRVRGPGGHSGEEVESGEVGGERERQSDGDGVGCDGRRCRMDRATSGTRRDSIRVETQPLAEVEMDQHGQRHHTTEYTPRPSIPPPRYARSLSACVDPPRRRLKSRPRSISTSRGPTRSHGCIEVGSGKSDASDMSYTARRWYRSDTESRNAKTRLLEPIEDEHAHLDSATISRAATCHIR